MPEMDGHAIDAQHSPVRITLRPLASPLPIGFFAFAIGSFLFLGPTGVGNRDLVLDDLYLGVCMVAVVIDDFEPNFRRQRRDFCRSRAALPDTLRSRQTRSHDLFRACRDEPLGAAPDRVAASVGLIAAEPFSPKFGWFFVLGRNIEPPARLWIER